MEAEVEKHEGRKGETKGKCQEREKEKESVTSEFLVLSKRSVYHIKDPLLPRLAATAASATQSRCTPSLYPLILL